MVLLVGAIVGYLVSQANTPPTTTLAALPVTTTTTIPPTTTPPTTLPPSTTTTTAPPTGDGILITAIEDTMVDSDELVEPLGAAPLLEIEQDETDTKRALIRFEVAGVPEGATIATATLNLAILDGSEQGGLINLVDGPWSEAETIWSSAPPLGAQIAPLVAPVNGTVVEVDVTPAVTGNGFIDFYLSTPSEDGIDIASRESGQTAPTLRITLTETAETPEQGAVLVGAGDIASCTSDGDEATAALLDEVVAEAPEAVVFTAGDNAYESGSQANFNECYQPSWGRHKAITRPAPGSREYRTTGASAYFEYFGEVAGDPAEGWYSYNLAGWHLIVLNSNCTEIGGCEAGSPQEQWLRADLAAHSTACTLAYWHQPLFSSRSGGTNPEMLPVFQALYDAEADVVISGNDHFYERFLPQDPAGEEDDSGITQFTVGTGGRSLDAFEGPSPNSGLRFNEAFGVLALNLYPGGYDWDFVTVPGTQFTDTGSGDCH